MLTLAHGVQLTRGVRRVPVVLVLLLCRVALGDVDAETARWFHGDVVVQVGGSGKDTPYRTSPHTRDEVNGVAKAILGHVPTLQEYAALFGAPDGSKLTVTVGRPEEIVVFVKNDRLGLHAERFLYRRNGEATIWNQEIHLANEAPAGMGTRILAHQVAAARKLGVMHIETSAARTTSMNGYYTWPRLGFDGPLPERMSVPASLGHPHTLGDVMKSEAGRTWWKANGETVMLSMSPVAGAHAHEAYLREKGIEVPHDGLLSASPRARAPGLMARMRGALRR